MFMNTLKNCYVVANKPPNFVNQNKNIIENIHRYLKTFFCDKSEPIMYVPIISTLSNPLSWLGKPQKKASF